MRLLKGIMKLIFIHNIMYIWLVLGLRLFLALTLHSLFIWSDGCTLDAHIVLANSISTVRGNYKLDEKTHGTLINTLTTRIASRHLREQQTFLLQINIISF